MEIRQFEREPVVTKDNRNSLRASDIGVVSHRLWSVWGDKKKKKTRVKISAGNWKLLFHFNGQPNKNVRTEKWGAKNKNPIYPFMPFLFL